MKKGIALFFATAIVLMLIGCVDEAAQEEFNETFNQKTAAVEVEPENSPELFRVIYEQRQELSCYQYIVVEFIPNGSLYLMRPNGGGVCPLLDWGAKGAQVFDTNDLENWYYTQR